MNEIIVELYSKYIPAISEKRQQVNNEAKNLIVYDSALLRFYIDSFKSLIILLV